ncbi:MAG: DNA-binding protein WhiA [Atribacterota bacterium]|jgi:hypothetical protein|nr:DNA-binding protein WhiA [Atribacterota bacterium]MDD4288206.1 DNA-binding protein WhiA [Atribacterota bacterium]MDI9596736.1 DNA-binding protein WhiA [Atribacterota bacterium]
MYFSSLVKQELAQIRPQDRLEQKGELMAFVLLNGHIDKKKDLLSINIENPVMIKAVYFLFKKIFDYEVEIETIKRKKYRKNYLIKIADFKKLRYILSELNLIVDSNGKITKKQQSIDSKNSCTGHFSNKGFLRGAFMTGGFVNDPERMYHLEISCCCREEAKIIWDVLESASFSSKISRWQKKWAVYIKKSEQIFEFLQFIGLQRALLNLQDIIARKDLINTVNRLVNCETANLDKTILSASRQLLYIDIIKEHIGMDNLSDNLKEVIQARLDNPYASIKELANTIGGSISKSGVYHRLRKIEQLASCYLTKDVYIS